MIYALLFFGFGFFVALLCTPWAIQLGQRGFGLDYAHETRKRQEMPVPRLGGMPVMLAVALGLAVIIGVHPEHAVKWRPILVGSVLMYGLGLWDDLRPLGARWKLVGQLATACLVFAILEVLGPVVAIDTNRTGNVPCPIGCCTADIKNHQRPASQLRQRRRFDQHILYRILF